MSLVTCGHAFRPLRLAQSVFPGLGIGLPPQHHRPQHYHLPPPQHQIIIFLSLDIIILNLIILPFIFRINILIIIITIIIIIIIIIILKSSSSSSSTTLSFIIYYPLTIRTLFGVSCRFFGCHFCHGLTKVCPDLFSIQMRNCIAA